MYEASRTSQSDGNKENSVLSTSLCSRQNRTAPAEHVFDLSKINDSIASVHGVNNTAPSERNVISLKSTDKRPPTPQTKHNQQSVIAEKKLDLQDSGSRSRVSTQERRDVGENQLKSRSKSVGTESSHTPSVAASKNTSVIRPSVSTTCLQNKHMVINGHCYMWINLLGKGGSSQVYEVFDETLSEVCALKVVNLGEDPLVRQCYLNEIELLKNLQGNPYVIKMLEYELRESENTLYVVMEKGDIDLATFLKTRRTEIDFAFIKYHWNEMLRCVKVIHDRKIVHSDLKPANFLLVKGSLKLIDFGIAVGIPSDMTTAVKESQMGTLSYMAPEVLQGEKIDGKFKIPLKADVWSLGCILYNMVYGHLPFPMKSQTAKIAAILNPEYAIDFSGCRDSLLVDVLKRCLVRDIHKRADVNELLEHPYLTGHLSRESQSSSLCGPKFDYLAIARELQNNTPNTMARRLEELTRGSQVHRSDDDQITTVKKVLDFDQQCSSP